MYIINILNRFDITVTDSIFLTFVSILLPFLTVVLGFKLFTLMLTKFNLGYQPIRDDGPSSHIAKKSKVFIKKTLLFLLFFSKIS